MIPNDYPGSGFFPIQDPGSRGKKSTGSRIRNTVVTCKYSFFPCLQATPRPAITPTGWTDRIASKFLSQTLSDSSGKNGQQNFSED
jgi:hypothetical protein